MCEVLIDCLLVSVSYKSKHYRDKIYLQYLLNTGLVSIYYYNTFTQAWLVFSVTLCQYWELQVTLEQWKITTQKGVGLSPVWTMSFVILMFCVYHIFFC